MAKSSFEYVKQYENDEKLLQNTFIVLRIDGRGFHEFSEAFSLEKPNDLRLLKLFNKCSREILKKFDEIVLAYGQSDEYSYAFRRSANLFNRRRDKILSCVVSYFSTCFVLFWPKYFPTLLLNKIPSFDGRIVLYPTELDLINYFKWRNIDCHINNLYNTAFWFLVNKKNMPKNEAHSFLQKTKSDGKNELLFQGGINYNNEAQIFRKGTFYRKKLKPKKEKVKKNNEEIKKVDIKETKIMDEKDVNHNISQEENKTQVEEVNNVKKIIENKKEELNEEITLIKETKQLNISKPKKHQKFHADLCSDKFWDENDFISQLNS